MNIYDWETTYTMDKPDILDDGVYTFSVIDVQESYWHGSYDNEPCESVLVYLNIEGFKIAERFFFNENMKKKTSHFLTSIGFKGYYDNFKAADIMKSVGKTGRCYVGHFEHDCGMAKNNIRCFIHPGEDAELVQWRELVKENANYTCENCGSRKNLQAHHKLPKEYFPDQKYNVKNGQCLCKECHKKVHAVKF